jgi:hypothetical protein
LKISIGPNSDRNPARSTTSQKIPENKGFVRRQR